MTQEADVSVVDRLWSARDCWQYLGIGQTSFYELVSTPDFPEALKIGRRAIRWHASEIRAFVDRQRVRRAADVS